MYSVCCVECKKVCNFCRQDRIECASDNDLNTLKIVEYVPNLLPVRQMGENGKMIICERETRCNFNEDGTLVTSAVV